ncbi:MAG: peptide chain release factor 2 [Acidaminococcaceae bacterium]|nr:peptide chain release factor 2 [Acidaminococcaceae bacterium]
MLLEEYRPVIAGLKNKLDEMRESLDIPSKEERIGELEHTMGEPTFWDDPEKAARVTKDVTDLKNEVDSYKSLVADLDDLEMLQEMAAEDQDESMVPEIDAALEKIKEELQHLELGMLLSEEYDANNAILTLHAGAGGTEAQDWTSMLLRMFTRFAERSGYQVETLDYQAGDEAGVKSATLQINGRNAYGFFRSEKGVHRLVRISPFDANARRHTSFAAVDVMPELDETVHVEINMDDVRVDYFRASGAGGQHVNKTSSAVRMTHLPTGIVVQCQNERSQLQNREKAMQMLRAKLYMYEKAIQDAKIKDLAGDYQAIEWGSQIRSYVFQPYTMVKDHRTNHETSNVQGVMDGDLQPFVEAYLRQEYEKKKLAKKQM